MPRGISIPWMSYGCHLVKTLADNPENDKK